MIMPGRICCDSVCVCERERERRGSHLQDMDGCIEQAGVTGESKTHQGFALSTRRAVSGIYNWD